MKTTGVISMALAGVAIAVTTFVLGARFSEGDATTEAVALESGASGATTPGETTRIDAGAQADIEPELVRSDGAQPDAPQEGVKVHGRWTIEVTEPDGRFVSRNEFDNDLVTQFGVGGRSTLVKILGHLKSVGYWRVELTGAVGAKPCTVTGGSGATTECVITELPASHSFVTGLNNYFSGLTVEVGLSDIGPNPDELVLTGSVAVQNAADITGVNTRLQLCPTDSTPADALSCSGPSNRFTEKTLDSPVPVLENQVVNVTVVFSFS